MAPKSKCVFVAAPPGFTEPASVASLAVTSVGASVETSAGAYACAKSLCVPGLPAVKRKNGVPTAPPWHAAPSALVGLAVQPEEIGARSGFATSSKPEPAMPVGVSSRKTGAVAPPSKWPRNVTCAPAISSCHEM